jgi:hypothetical protein
MLRECSRDIRFSTILSMRKHYTLWSQHQERDGYQILFVEACLTR